MLLPPVSPDPKMQALILAGGSGTRFWPLSRKRSPKQLLTLEGDQSLLRATLSRISPLIEPRSVWISTTRELAAPVREQVPEVPPEQVLEEPEGRNTSAAIGWAVRSMPPPLRQGVVAVLPADHRMGDPTSFRRVLDMAGSFVEDTDRVVALGVAPRWPETGYGYLELGEVIDAEAGAREVKRFVEKPDAAAARRFLASGNYLWNAGIFVFRGERILDLLTEYQPDIAHGLEVIAREPDRLAEIYPQLPAISIDFGVMEKVGDSATLPLDCEWSDLGSWAALWEVMEQDEAGNATRGGVVTVDCHNNLIVADQGVVAALGITDLVIVRSADAVLVVPRERAQEVRRLVQKLKDGSFDELL